MSGRGRWKTTAAMAASYAAASVAVYIVVKDQTTAVVILFVLFALILLSGNMYLRASGKAQGAKQAANVGPGRPPMEAQGHAGSLHHAHRNPQPDPELGRR